MCLQQQGLHLAASSDGTSSKEQHPLYPSGGGRLKTSGRAVFRSSIFPAATAWDTPCSTSCSLKARVSASFTCLHPLQPQPPPLPLMLLMQVRLLLHAAHLPTRYSARQCAANNAVQ
jgi:hypothetical protein